MDKFLSLQLLQEIIISSAFCFGFFLFVLIGGPGALSFFLKKNSTRNPATISLGMIFFRTTWKLLIYWLSSKMEVFLLKWKQ